MVTDRHTAPDYAHSALVTIDVQQDMLDGQPFEIPGTTRAIPQIARLAQEFRETDRPIIHVVRLYAPDGSNADRCRRSKLESGVRLVLIGSPGRALVPEILPSPNLELDDEALMSGKLQTIGRNEWILYKPRWGAFYQTPLEELLRSTSVSTIVLAGINYPNCVRATIYEASERDFRITAVSDATSNFDEFRRAELEEIGVAVESSVQLIRLLHASETKTRTE